MCVKGAVHLGAIIGAIAVFTSRLDGCCRSVGAALNIFEFLTELLRLVTVELAYSCPGLDFRQARAGLLGFAAIEGADPDGRRTRIDRLAIEVRLEGVNGNAVVVCSGPAAEPAEERRQALDNGLCIVTAGPAARAGTGSSSRPSRA